MRSSDPSRIAKPRDKFWGGFFLTIGNNVRRLLSYFHAEILGEVINLSCLPHSGCNAAQMCTLWICADPWNWATNKNNWNLAILLNFKCREMTMEKRVKVKRESVYSGGIQQICGWFLAFVYPGWFIIQHIPWCIILDWLLLCGIRHFQPAKLEIAADD